MNWKYNNPNSEYEKIFDDAAWPWSGHKNFAYDLISHLKPQKIVELGTHYGTSLWSFSQAIKDSFLDTEIFAVDTWKGEPHAGFYGEEVFETVNKIKNIHYPKQKITFLRKTFNEALSDFQNESIDILHIDGLHTYEAVKNDFETWLPKVKKNGIILFHDIEVSEDDFGVFKLWKELKEEYKTVSFHHSFGLGVIFLDPEKNSELLRLEKEFQRHYSYAHEMKKIEKLNNLKASKLEELNSCKTEIDKIKKDLEKKEAQLISVVSTLRWKIPNFFYKFYTKRIRKYIPKFVIVVFRKITYFFEFCFRMANKYYNLSRMAKDEWKINGWNGLSFALKRHWQKRRGKILVSYPTESDYEKNLVSIGILTINHLELIKPCIESIEKNLSQKYEVEILIGDTGSTEKEVWKFYKKAQKKYRNIKIIKFKSYFFSRNYNDLVKMCARGEYLIFLNNDTIVKENWIDNLVNPLKNKKIGIVGGKLLYQNETIQHAGIEINEKGNFAHKFSKEKSDLPEANYSALVPAVTFACVATRHDIFDRFKLSENFKEESQDTDFCLRLQEAGFDIFYEPRVEIYHLECSTRDWRKGSPDHTAFHEKYKEKIEQILKSQQRIRFNNKYEKSISIIRDDGIGDLLMAVSAFKNLKEKHQNKKLILLTYERNIEMMRGFKIFDEILPIPNGLKYSPLPIPTPKDRTFNLIDMEMKFGHTFAKAKDSNKINRHLVLAEKLKVDKKYEPIPMPEYPEAKREIEKILSEMNVDFNQNFVVFNLIASNPARSWWEPYYPTLIRAVEELGFTPLIVGTENSPYFQGEKIVNLVGKTKNIQEYIEAVKLGKYVISTDTSAYHIAALAGIPFLAIFTGGVLPEARLQNYEKYEVIKPKNLSCYPCWDEGCKDMSLRQKKDPCRLIIKPEQVIEKFKRLIKKY